MALSGGYFDRRALDSEKDSILTQRVDYTPLSAVSSKDKTEQIATTSFVSNYRQDIIDLGTADGNVVLDSGRAYKLSLSGDATFTLPTPISAEVKNDITLYIRLPATDTKINWGDNVRFLNTAPLRYGGDYRVMYSWLPEQNSWCVGSYPEGENW